MTYIDIVTKDGDIELRERIKDWFLTQMLAWQKRLQRRASVTEFAEHVGVTRNTMTNWLNRGQRPEGENLKRVVAILGPGIYDVLRIPTGQRDQKLERFEAGWDLLREDGKDALLAQLEELLGSGQASAMVDIEDDNGEGHGPKT